jgi:GlpG protein
MRNIGNLADETQAREFGNFLIAQGIRNQLERDSGHSWDLWVLDDDQVATAQGWLEKFRANPNAPEFQGAAARAAKARQAEAQEQADYQRRVRTRQNLFPKLAGSRPVALTYGLIVLCVVVAIYSNLGKDQQYLRQLYITDSASGFLPEVRAGEVWRLITPIFIHFSAGHIIFNMLWLFQLGMMIESRRGAGTLALLVLVIGLVSNLCQYLVDNYALHVHNPFGGMSGVVYGLAGYVWMMGRFYRASGLYLHPQNVMIMLVWLVICYTGWVGPVANTVHLTGLTIGVIWGRLAAYWASRRPE